MTIEKAIITLKNTAFLLRDGTRYMKPEHEKQFREAYEMAIKALEHEREIAYLINPTPYGECSKYGQLIDSRDGFDFCPHCGAKLER